MPGTMTWVGFDVDARSAHAAAIDVMTGELSGMRFGPGLDAPVAWLCSLPGPVRACDEAGPAGFGLDRAVAAGIDMPVIAPGLTPRGRSDRVKTDPKDSGLLARCLMAGSLTPIVVPSLGVEAARELIRAHDACRRELMNARERVSTMLLRHGRVYPKPSAWTQEHRRWLSRQQFEQPTSELTDADLIACVDGLTARKQALAERIGELALDQQWWPTVARRRAFRGVDTLTAVAIHLELGADWERLQKAHRVGSWLGLTPSHPVRRVRPARSDHEDRIGARPPAAEVSAWHDAREPRIGATLTNRQEGQPDHVLQIADRAQLRLHRVDTGMRARGTPHNVTVVACARELACLLWAAATAP